MCGHESVVLTDPSSTITKQYVRHSFYGGNTSIPESEVHSYFTSSRPVNCPPLKFFLQMQKPDGSFARPDTSYVTVDPYLNVIIKTNVLYSVQLYIVTQETANSP